jgi:hypothetical protein
MEARAARDLPLQKFAVTEDGAVMAADRPRSSSSRQRPDSVRWELLAQNKTPRSIELDVMDEEGQSAQWDRDERHDFSLSLSTGASRRSCADPRPPKWIRHFLSFTVNLLTGDRRRTLGVAYFRCERADS